MIWAVLALLAAVFAAPFVVERFKPRMDNSARRAAPGQFARLSGGMTHYRWHRSDDGPDDGPVMVCIHGLTTPSFVWDELLPGLTGAGYRVLTYDHYGRGFSDRPGGAQDDGFFIRQLRELLQDQGVETPVTLFGYSMGGALATVFAAAEPQRVARVVLLAPAGMVYAPGLLGILARRVPLVGDWLHLALAGRQLVRHARPENGATGLAAEMPQRQRAENARRGFLPAVLSSQRHLLDGTLEAEHRELAARGLPVAAIWAEADTVIPITGKHRLAGWNPDARQAVVPGAEHGLAFTHSNEVLGALRDLL
ncbi:MAG: alpha/beta hydrolase [Rhodobacteraceae bacterium]|nr:alpha/beta hydrolase [Paracoccaceae bacterium]